MLQRLRAAAPILLAVLVVLLLGEIVGRALIAGGPLRAKFYEPERRFLDRSFGAAPAADERTIVYAGTSLAMAEATYLPDLLDDALGDDVDVWNEARPGDFLGDLYAAIRVSAEEGVQRAILEINPYLFNERERFHFSPQPDKTIWRRRVNALTLWRVGSDGLRRDLWTQDAVSPLLGGVLQRIYAPYALGRAIEEPVERLVQRLPARAPDAPAAGAAAEASEIEELRRIQTENFALKSYDQGSDPRLLEEILDWASSWDGELTLYLPPLNLVVLEEDLVAAEEAEALRRLRSWQADLISRAADADVRTIDLTEALIDRPELFRDDGNDYGHLGEESLREIAAILAKRPEFVD